MIRPIHLIIALLSTFTPAQAQAPQRLGYVDFKQASPPADVRSLWADILARNNAEFPASLAKLRGPNGEAPAQALSARIPGGIASILSSPISCRMAGSGTTATWTNCLARVQIDGKIVRAEACFVSADFDPLPGQTTANTYSTVEIDQARRVVRFGGVDRNRVIPECRIEVRY